MSTTRDVLASEATGWTADEHAAVQALRDLMGRIDRDKPDPDAVQQLRAMFYAVPQLATAPSDDIDPVAGGCGGHAPRGAHPPSATAAPSTAPAPRPPAPVAPPTGRRGLRRLAADDPWRHSPIGQARCA